MRRTWGWVAIGVVAVLGLSGCLGGGKSSTTKGAPAGAAGASEPASPSSSPPAAVSFTPADGATSVRMDKPISVKADQGTLTSVEVKSSAGKVIPGELDPAKTQWQSTGVLTSGTDYTVTAVANSQDGRSVTQKSGFTTLKPTATSSLVLNVGDGQTVGVGMPIVLQFGRSVKNRDAAVKALTVETTPEVEGAWRWMSAQSVWWRPKAFWPSGTKVKVTAAIAAVELAPGVWGRRSYTSEFSIGSRVVSTVDVQKHTMTVTKDGKLVRVLPVTTGKSTPDGKFLTRGGTKVIMERLESVRMDAATTGTDAKDPEFYNEVEHWAMRLTWSGEYLHARTNSEYAFGRSNVSHGCTGLSNANAKWLFDFSKIGDVVQYVGSKRQLEWGNGYTAWEMSYPKWSAGG